jgi:hypothetical protein
MFPIIPLLSVTMPIDRQGSILILERRCDTAELSLKVNTVWQINLPVIFVLCVLQAVVPAWGAVLCVGDDGRVAIKLMTGCPLETPADTCESGRDAGSCPCCISGANPRDCSDTPVSPFLRSLRSNIQKTPETQSGVMVAVPGTHTCTLSVVATHSSRNIRNPFFIERVTQLSISSVVLRI